jgi:hypothetical protein
LPIEHQPVVQGLHQRLTLFLADAQTILGTELFDLAFYRIDLRYLPDCLFGNLALPTSVI